MKFLKNILVLFILLLSSIAIAQNKWDDIIDTWLTNGKEPAKIEITKLNGKYFGKIIWLKYPTDDRGVKRDVNNPNKSLRNQKIIGLTIVKDFTFDGSNKWTDGEIYDPESGKIYSCNIKLYQLEI